MPTAAKNTRAIQRDIAPEFYASIWRDPADVELLRYIEPPLTRAARVHELLALGLRTKTVLRDISPPPRRQKKELSRDTNAHAQGHYHNPGFGQRTASLLPNSRRTARPRGYH